MNKIKELFKPLDLTNGRVWKVIVSFSIPILISYIFQQIYTIADAAICGQFLNENQVAGVNNTGNIVFIVLQFAFGCTAGFSVITSRNLGQKDVDGIKRSLATQIVLSFIISVLLTIVAILSINPLLKWIGLEKSSNPVQNEIYRSAYVYVLIIFAGSITQIFYNLISSFLRSVGDSLTPLVFLIISTVLNIALDLLFVAVFKTGVAGAAVATVISQAISAVGCFAYTFARYKEYRLTKSDFKLEKDFVIRYGNTYLYCDLSLYYILGVLFVLRNSLQGIEKSLFPFVAGVGELVARTVLCLVLPAAINNGPINVGASQNALLGLTFADPLAWAAASAVLLYGAFKYIFSARSNPRSQS